MTHHPCILRCGGLVKPTTYLYSRKDIKLRRRVGVCDTCGHVQITPVYSERDQSIINQLMHSHFVSDDNSADQKKKLDQTLERLQGLELHGKMLDVGPGEGWAMGIADFDEYHIVETYPELIETLKKKGAILASEKISGLDGKYDFVFFRGVLEHLIDPMADLRTLSNSLADDGYIYVCVPDLMQLSGKKGYRTNSLRPCHISYFTMDKLLWSLSMVGLRPVRHGDEQDLWVVAEKGQSHHEMQNEYQKNRELVLQSVRKHLVKDTKNIVDVLRHLA